MPGTPGRTALMRAAAATSTGIRAKQQASQRTHTACNTHLELLLLQKMGDDPRRPDEAIPLPPLAEEPAFGGLVTLASILAMVGMLTKARS